MVRLTVLYGHPEDPAAFDRYYHDVHLPLARKMHGLTGWTLGKCEPTGDASQAPYYMIVGLYAESKEALQSILESPEGQAAIADVPHFATGGATFFVNDEHVELPLALSRAK